MSQKPPPKAILLVEDEALIAMGEAAMLQKHGLEVKTVTSGEKAVEAMKTAAVDLILMDIDLGRGRMNGTEAAEMILKEHDIPIVFLTSHSEEKMVDKVKGITRYGYVLKNAGEFVLRESINMAFELFEAHRITKESEEKYKASFMTSPDAVNINRIDGLYVDINEGFTALTGFTREDVIGKLSSEIEIWAVPEDRIKLIRGLKTTGVVENLESRFRRKDGTLTTALMSARLITINNEPHILSVTRDISHRKKAEEEAVKAKAFLDNISDIAYEADTKGNVVYVNPAAEKITGIPIDDLIGKPFLPLFIEKDRASLMEVYRKTLRGERLENTLTFESGATCHFTTLPKYDAEGGNIVGTFGVARDISEQKKIQEQSEQQGLLYRQLVDNAGMGIGFWEPEGRLRMINRQAAEHLGGSSGDFEGKTIGELFGAEWGKLYLERIKKTAAEQKKQQYGNDKVALPGGDRWFFSTYNCIYNEKQEVIGVVIISNDVTNIKASEANIQALLESTDDVIVFRDTDGKAIIYNEAFRKIVDKLFGVEAFPGIRTMDYLPDDRQRFWEETIVRVLSGERITERFSYTFHDGEMREYELTFNPVYVEGSVIGFSEINRDITDLLTNEKALRESEENFKTLFELSPDALVVAEAESGVIVNVNNTAAELFEYPEDQLIGLNITDLHPKEWQVFVRNEFDKGSELLTGLLRSLEIEVVTSQNLKKPVEIRASAFFRNETLYMLGSFRDISKRKEAENQKKILMEEFNHRVKNNLMMVSSLIDLKNMEIGDGVNLSDLSRQIDAIRMVHERFYRSEDITRIHIARYVNDLLQTVFALAGKPVAIDGSIDVEYLHSREAVPLGLIINEIATNAVKHGFSDEADARFSIDLREDGTRDQFVLTLSNTGNPFPAVLDLDNPGTLGLRLISALVEQLEGSIDLKREPHPVFTIRFPAG